MNDRLKTIVDLEKYPIHDLNSPIIKNLIKNVKKNLINIVVLQFQILFYLNHLR